MIERPDSDTCHVWWAHVRSLTPSMHRLLDEQETARAKGFSREADRNRFGSAHSLLRVLAGAYLGEPADRVEIVRSCAHCGAPHGKPRVLARQGPELEVSMSHTADRVVIAVCGVATGIDIERVRQLRNLDRIAAATLSPSERLGLEQVPPGERATCLLGYWTRKEAVLKALGCGLLVAPETLVLSSPAELPRVVEWPTGMPRTPMALRLLASPLGAGFVGAVAIAAPCPVVVWERDGGRILDLI